MPNNPFRHTVLIVDNTDPDNALAALVACNLTLRLNLAAIIVTGRFAASSREAHVTYGDPIESQEVRSRNARRMVGTLGRHGYDVPVFEGSIPPRTIVPHGVHIDERLMDPFSDEQYSRTNGDFAAALDYLATLEGTIDFIVGGPLTEIAQIMDDVRINQCLGTLTCQLGMFGFADVQTMAGGRVQFNAACDVAACRRVLHEYPGEMYMVPTDITKLPEVGFDIPESMRSFVPEEIRWLYTTFYTRVLSPRGERIYPHDVHAVFAMVQYRGTAISAMYEFLRVRVVNVSENGEISIEPVTSNTRRYVAMSVDEIGFMRCLQRCRQP